MSGFGEAPLKGEGYTQDYETGQSHPTTAAEREKQLAYFASPDFSTYMELCIKPRRQSREEIHKMVDNWLDAFEAGK
jgi:hypothetical protein